MGETLIGEVTHYYTDINVAIIKLNKQLNVGDTVHFSGHTTDFTEEINDMEYDHEKIESADAGQEVGVKVSQKVRDGDEVYLVE